MPEHVAGSWKNEGVSPPPDVESLIAIRAGEETVAYALEWPVADSIAAFPDVLAALSYLVAESSADGKVMRAPTRKAYGVAEAALAKAGRIG